MHPDGVQRHHGEWRVRPLYDRARDITRVGILRHVGQEFFPATVPDTIWPVTSPKGLLDTGPDDVREDHEPKRQKSDETPTRQEPSSGSGIQRSTADIEAMRRADAEAGKGVEHVLVCSRNDEQPDEHEQHRWMSWRSPR